MHIYIYIYFVADRGLYKHLTGMHVFWRSYCRHWSGYLGLFELLAHILYIVNKETISYLYLYQCYNC